MRYVRHVHCIVASEVVFHPRLKFRNTQGNCEIRCHASFFHCGCRCFLHFYWVWIFSLGLNRDSITKGRDDMRGMKEEERIGKGKRTYGEWKGGEGRGWHYEGEEEHERNGRGRREGGIDCMPGVIDC